MTYTNAMNYSDSSYNNSPAHCSNVRRVSHSLAQSETCESMFCARAIFLWEGKL